MTTTLSTAPLLATKFFIPPAPPGDLLRPRLFALMDELLLAGKRLGLVCAPAGYGKTTLVADWLRGRASVDSFTAAWLSLEESENDPQQFLLYLTAGLRRALSAAQMSVDELDLLAESIPSAAPQVVLGGLVNALSALPGTLILVLDDYQAIHTPAIHGDLAFFIEHLPPNAHLVITTRSDPPLPLHRYRARGQVVEIRLDELRLNSDELDHLLAEEATSNQAVAGLGREEAGILAERTEGWPAGVHMAVLSLRGRPDAREFIHTWSGSQRYILDYLAEEVHKAQPAAVQQFLVQTAVLDRMCAALCSAVIRDSLFGIREENGFFTSESRITESRITNPESILEYLHQSNLFLISLDSDHTWFRYHHLFLDLLRVRLKGLGAEAVAGLHRRAAGWLEANGWLREAIQHCIQAGDFDHAAELVEQHTLRLFSEGELQALLAWIRLLPEEVAAKRPWLRIYQAWALTFAGKLADALHLCQPVEELLASGAMNHALAEPERSRLRAELYGIRAMVNLMSGKIGEVLPFETLPAELLLPGSEFARSAVHWTLGYAWRMQGRLDKAIPAFTEMQRLGLEINNHWTVLSAAVDLGMSLRMNGRLREAEAVYRGSLQNIQQAGMGGAGFAGRLESFLANAVYEKNDVEEAGRLARSSIRHNRYWDNPNHNAHAWATLARICLAEGARRDIPGAEEALLQAEQAAQHPGVVPTLPAMITALRLKLYLAQNDRVQVMRWLEAHPIASGPGGLQTEMSQVIGAACARARLYLGDAAGAFALLEQMEAAARSAGQIHALIENLVLQARAARDPHSRRAALLEALDLGCPQGYARVFLDEGEPLREELSAALAWLKRERPAAADTSQRAAWIEALLARFPIPAEEESALPSNSPLTEREVEILRAMAAGLSNPEIGKHLYISAGTVKAHSAAIYRKLDVANRAEAIAKAKDIGLL